MKDLIREIRDDLTSGASQLTLKALEAMKKAVELSKARDPEGLYQGLVEVGKALVLAQPSIASIFNLVNSFILRAEKGLKMKRDELRELMRRDGEKIEQELIRAQTMINLKGRKLLQEKNTVLTYSYSATVRDILLGRKGLRVILSEGRPEGEGRLLAKDLGGKGIRCTLMVDAALASFLPEVDLVLVGVDRVSEGTFVNKIGTKGLAVQAKELGVLFYAAATTYKFLPSQILPFQPQLRDPAQISPQLQNVEIVNILFEEVPLAYLSGVITEEGVLSPEQISQRVKGIKISPAMATFQMT